MFSRIVGTGGYLPEKVLTNHDLESMVDTTHEWIVARTGIHQRHIAAENETTCDLAQQAALQAMDAAGIRPEDIELIIIATTTADQVFPSTACKLQHRLNIPQGPAFDVQAVCAGFIYALDIADKYIRSGTVKRALVVGAETFSRIIDWTDRNTCVLFGDGAGAVILEAAAKPGIIASHITADGRYRNLLEVPGGVSSAYQDVQNGRAYVRMQGHEVFKWAVKALGNEAQDMLAANHLSVDELDWLVPHQANIRIISAMAKRLHIPMERVIKTIHRHGNTSAASVPLALNMAVRDGRIQAGQKILLEAFGGGFTWGSVLIHYI
ncbi:MAG TPA: ketoacyl-ACP synthase III [Gammaproteobacteria bacterium]|nr:ketoacyl-ACP synthase III [Gammaproteobacteria bacterium]